MDVISLLLLLGIVVASLVFGHCLSRFLDVLDKRRRR